MTGDPNVIGPGAQPPVGAGPTATGNEPPKSQWFERFSQEQRGYLDNRGLTRGSEQEAFDALLQSYRGAESKLGAPANELVRYPSNNDPTLMNEFYSKIGRPVDPKGYELPVEKGDEQFADWFATKAHSLGLNKAQAQTLMKEWNGYAQSLVTENEQQTAKDTETTAAKQVDALKSNWGNNFEMNLRVANATFNEFAAKAGVTEQELQPMLEALKGSIGGAKVMEMFHAIGRAMGEDSFVGGEGNGQGKAFTAAQAQQMIADLKADKAWARRYVSGDVQAKQQMAELMGIAYGS